MQRLTHQEMICSETELKVKLLDKIDIMMNEVKEIVSSPMNDSKKKYVQVRLMQVEITLKTADNLDSWRK